VSSTFCLTTGDKLFWADCLLELATGIETLECTQIGLH